MRRFGIFLECGDYSPLWVFVLDSLRVGPAQAPLGRNRNTKKNPKRRRIAALQKNPKHPYKTRRAWSTENVGLLLVSAHVTSENGTILSALLSMKGLVS
jgi:hypothetical protein